MANDGPPTLPPLTRQDMLDLFEDLKNAPPHPCKLGQHVVHPDAIRKGGWWSCASCGRPVKVEPEVKIMGPELAPVFLVQDIRMRA